MTLTAKKARIQNQKRAIYMFSFMAVISLFVVCFAVQYHKEIVAAVEFVEELF